MGHDGLQATLRLPDADRARWRGFVFSSGGQAINQSGFNIPDGTPPPDAGRLLCTGGGCTETSWIDLVVVSGSEGNQWT